MSKHRAENTTDTNQVSAAASAKVRAMGADITGTLGQAAQAQGRTARPLALAAAATYAVVVVVAATLAAEHIPSARDILTRPFTTTATPHSGSVAPGLGSFTLNHATIRPTGPGVAVVHIEGDFTADTQPLAPNALLIDADGASYAPTRAPRPEPTGGLDLPGGASCPESQPGLPQACDWIFETPDTLTGPVTLQLYPASQEGTAVLIVGAIDLTPAPALNTQTSPNGAPLDDGTAPDGGALPGQKPQGDTATNDDTATNPSDAHGAPGGAPTDATAPNGGGVGDEPAQPSAPLDEETLAPAPVPEPADVPAEAPAEAAAAAAGAGGLPDEVMRTDIRARACVNCVTPTRRLSQQRSTTDV